MNTPNILGAYCFIDNPFKKNVFHPYLDVSSLFILQLGCVVNMSSRWKKLSLRVWIRVMDSMGQDEVQASAEKLLHGENPCSSCVCVNLRIQNKGFRNPYSKRTYPCILLKKYAQMNFRNEKHAC